MLMILVDPVTLKSSEPKSEPMVAIMWMSSGLGAMLSTPTAYPRHQLLFQVPVFVRSALLALDALFLQHFGFHPQLLKAHVEQNGAIAPPTSPEGDTNLAGGAIAQKRSETLNKAVDRKWIEG